MYASFQNVLFVFTNLTDTDLSTYEYQLFESTQIVNPSASPYTLISGASPFRTGTGTSSVFSVPLVSPVTGSYVDGSGVTQQKSFFGRVRAIDTSGNIGNWSAIAKTSTSTPLIDEQYIVSLTASRITAGKIGAHEIILTQPGAQTSYTPPANTAVLRSSNYAQGSAGWLIRGDGLAEFNNLTVRTQLDIGGDDSTSFHVDNAGNMWSGSGISNFSTAPFRVTNAGVLTATNANITGTISGSTITASTITGNNIATGDIYIREQVSKYPVPSPPEDPYRYYLTYLLGDYLQIKRMTNSSYSSITGSGAFIGYYNAGAVADDAAMIVNSTTPYTSGTYVSAQSNGNLVATGLISASKITIGGGGKYYGGMQGGSLELGDTGLNFYYSSGWSGSMGAGILANCADRFEWVIHDSGTRLASPMYYEGDTNRIYIGRDLGWGVTPLYVQSTLNVASTLTCPSIKLPNHTVTSDTWRMIINPDNYTNLQIGIGEFYGNAGVYASGSSLRFAASTGTFYWTDGANNQKASLDAYGNLYVNGAFGMANTATSASADYLVRDGNSYFYIKSSNRALKDNIELISDSINVIDKLQPVRFNWLTDSTDEIDIKTKREYRSMGFILEDVLDISPELVTWRRNENGEIYPGYWKIDDFIALAIQGIKDLKSEIDSLKKELESLR